MSGAVQHRGEKFIILCMMQTKSVRSFLSFFIIPEPTVTHCSRMVGDLGQIKLDLYRLQFNCGTHCHRIWWRLPIWAAFKKGPSTKYFPEFQCVYSSVPSCGLVYMVMDEFAQIQTLRTTLHASDEVGHDILMI